MAAIRGVTTQHATIQSIPAGPAGRHTCYVCACWRQFESLCERTVALLVTKTHRSIGQNNSREAMFTAANGRLSKALYTVFIGNCGIAM